MLEAKNQFVFNQFGLGGILRQFRLMVPPNQREYSWTEREVTTLLQDLAKAISEEEKEYFLGTIVTIPRGPDLLEIVDGQQRLATTAIILAEIRNFLAKDEPMIAESISHFLNVIDREKRDRVPKLALNVEDNEFFKSVISDSNINVNPEKPSHDLMADAVKKIRGHIQHIVSTFDKKYYGDILNKWIDFIDHGATVILLQVPNDVNAYRMFETLNDRGLKTSQADLVKNYLFGKSAERLQETQQRWATMKGILETLEEDDITVTFLRYSLIAMEGYLREPDVYEKVREHAKGATQVLALLDNFESLAIIYVAIFNPEHVKWNKYPDSMRRAIQTLNLLNIKPMRSLIMSIAMRFEPKEASEAFQMLISCGVRLLIASSTRSGSVEQAFASVAKFVFKKDITDSKTLQAKLEKVIPNDEQFRHAFEVATISKAALARYYLRSLEMAAKGESSPWFVLNDDRQTINLEHILPENPGNGWEEYNEESIKTYSKRIGNLALLLAKSNSDLKSADFETKKAVYAESPYELTRQISDATNWTPTDINDRQKTLSELALKAWPY